MRTGPKVMHSTLIKKPRGFYESKKVASSYPRCGPRGAPVISAVFMPLHVYCARNEGTVGRCRNPGGSKTRAQQSETISRLTPINGHACLLLLRWLSVCRNLQQRTFCQQIYWICCDVDRANRYLNVFVDVAVLGKGLWTKTSEIWPLV